MLVDCHMSIGTPCKCWLLQGTCLRNCTLWQRKEMHGGSRGLASTLATNAQLEAEALVRKLENLRLEKHMRVSTTLLVSGLADKVGKQDN